MNKRLLFFKAPWCSACHAIEPYVEDWIERVDCSENEEVAIKYGITHLPVFIAVDTDGEEIARIQTTSMPALKSWFEAL